MEAISLYDKNICLKVTETGREQLRHIYNQLRNHPTMLVSLGPYQDPEEDEDGYSVWSLKEIIDVFGTVTNGKTGVMSGKILSRYFDPIIKIRGKQDDVDSTGSSSDC